MTIVFNQGDSETTSGSIGYCADPVSLSKKKQKSSLHRVFLSGKRTELSDKGRIQFCSTANLWRIAGYEVVNPTEICVGVGVEHIRGAVLKKSYQALINQCEAVAVLPGWRDCPVATSEVHLAQALGYDVFDATAPGRLIDIEPDTTYYTKKAFAELQLAKSLLHSQSSLRNKPTPVCSLNNNAKPELAAAEPLCGVTGEPGVESCCDIADRLVETTRQHDYGSPVDDFARIAGMATALGFRFVDASGKVRNILPSDHGIWMVLTKISREMHNHKRDNLIDGAGYFKCLDKLHNLK